MRARIVVAALVALLWPVLSATYAAGTTRDEPALDLGGGELPGGRASTDRANPVVLPPGTWADTLGPAGGVTDTHYFRYERAIADSTVHVAVVGSSLDQETTDGLEIAAYVDGADCGSQQVAGDSSVPHGLFGRGFAVGPSDLTDRTSVCLTSPSIDLAISRGTSSSTAALPIAIRVVEEAPILNGSSLPEVAELTIRARAPGDEVDVEGSVAFDDAPSLPPGRDGRSTHARVAEGEARLWQVPLRWGERLNVTVRIPVKDEETHESMNRWDPRIKVTLVDPMRRPFSEFGDSEPAGRYNVTESATLFTDTPAVAYRNRFVNAIAAVPGDYWVSVAVSPPNDERRAIEVPMEVSFHVIGQVAGEPTYPTTVTGPGGEPPPRGYHPDRPFLVADGAFAAAVTADGSGPGWWGIRRGVGLGLAALSLASLAAGGLWLRRVG